jgi:hypothetical protein
VKMKSKKLPSIVGRTAQVDICPRDAGYVLSVGPVSLWLPLDVARDVVTTLARALLVDTLGVEPSQGLHRHGDGDAGAASAGAAPPARGTSN